MKGHLHMKHLRFFACAVTKFRYFAVIFTEAYLAGQMVLCSMTIYGHNKTQAKYVASARSSNIVFLFAAFMHYTQVRAVNVTESSVWSKCNISYAKYRYWL